MKIKLRRKIAKKAEPSRSALPHEQTAPPMHPALKIAVFIVVLLAAVNLFGSYLSNKNTSEMQLKPSTAMTGLVNPDTPAPDFILPNLKNGQVSNKNFKGYPLVILFWSTWNQLSQDELRTLDAYMAHNPGIDLKVLAIDSQEDKNQVSSFISRGGYKLPIAIDSTGSVGEAYGAHYLPAMYFIDSTGIVKDSLAGYLDETTFTQKLGEISE